MWRAVLFLALLYAGLALLDRGDAAEPGLEIRPLVEPELAASLTVAAIEFHEPAREETLLYARSKGLWRCVSTFGAVCDHEAMAELLHGFTRAHGVVRTEDPELAAEFGFTTDEMFRVSFHGPQVLESEDRDVLLSFDVGRALPGARHGRSFVRATESDVIHEIDRDVRPLLERPRTRTIPPLMDRRILAGPWEGRGAGFDRIVIERADGATTEVRLIAVEPEGPDQPGWAWHVTEGSRSGRAPYHRALGYTSFALQATYSGFANPEEAVELGLVPAAARIRLRPTDGDVIDLVVGRPSPRGATSILHRQTGMLMQTDAETARLFMPDAATLLEPELGNPWELWLTPGDSRR